MSVASKAPRRRVHRRSEKRNLARSAAGGVGVIAIVVVLAIVALGAPSGLPFVSYRTAYTTIPDVGNLQAHNDIRIAGVRVGQVLAETTQAGGVRLTLQLSSGVGSLPSDTTAVVRSNGLLGERYLQLIPGTSQQPLPDGGTIRAGALSLTLGIPEALQVFDTQTRGALTQMVDGLGGGLVGRGPGINDALSVSPQAAHDFQQTAQAILNPSANAARLVGSFETATAALDGAKESLARLLSPAHVALQPFVDQRAAVQQSLVQAPPTLSAASAALARSLTLLTTVRALSGAVNQTLPPAPQALAATNELLRDSPPSLTLADALLSRAKTAVPATLQITSSLQPVLAPLKQPLDNLLQPVKSLGAHACDITNFTGNWGSMLGFGTAQGGGQIGPMGEIRATPIVQMPFAEAGTALQLPATIVQRNSYPAPCAYPGTTYSLTDPLK
jgi:phospholipid/cholesterol/gamma-HCH transport system substrate-binding protein